MMKMGFRPGDMVMYKDREQMRWGPWEVLDIKETTATLLVENQIRYIISLDLIQKAGHN